MTPVATNTIEFEWGGCRIIQHQTFFAVAVDRVEVSFANQEELELQTISAHGWWYARRPGGDRSGRARHDPRNCSGEAVEAIDPEAS